MQRLRSTGEDGAVAILVGIMTVVLFGMGALVIDIGAMYAERRQLQNGADAAALAVALECAKGRPCVSDISGNVLAAQYANGNANDGEARLDNVTPNFGRQEVKVGLSTLNDGATALPPVFGRLVARDDGYDGATIQADATARWGGPSRHRTSPLGITSCAFLAAGGYKYMPVTGEGTPINDLPDTCGFGWLNALSCDTSVVDLRVGDPVSVGPVPQDDNCRTRLNQLLDADAPDEPVPVPIYDRSGGDATVVGFAAFILTRYRLRDHHPPGLWQSAPPADCSLPTASCIQGHFVFITTDEGDFGGPAMGLTIVRLID